MMYNKRKYDPGNYPENKESPPYDDEEEVQLPALIQKIGDNVEISKLCSNIQSLAVVLKRDIISRKNIITDEICDCISKMNNKISIYVTLLGMLNAQNNDFGADFVESLSVAFQDSLNSQNFGYACNILLAFSELVNVNVVSPISLLSLLDYFISFAAEKETPAPYSNWILSTILTVIPWSGAVLEQSKTSKSSFSQLLSSISNLLGKRNKEYVKALRIWAKPDLVPQEENLDLLWLILVNFRKSGWRTDVISSPYSTFKTEFADSLAHKIGAIKLPTNVQLKKFPVPSLSFFLFNPSECETFSICGNILPQFDQFERNFFSVKILQIINSSANRKQCLLKLKELVTNPKYNVPYIIVDTVFAQIFKPATYEGSSVLYYNILVDLCVGYKEVFPKIIKQAVVNIQDIMEHMNVACLQRFTEWFSYHLNCTLFEWGWNEFDDDFDLPMDHPKKIFLLELFERLIRLANVAKYEPVMDKYLQLYQKERIYTFKYEKTNPNEKKLVDNIIKILSSKHQIKETNEQLIKVVTNAKEVIDSYEEITKIVISVFLLGGKETPFRTQSIFSKCIDTAKFLINTNESRMNCMEAIFDFWQYDPFRLILTIDLFIRLHLLTYESIVLWLFKSNTMIKSLGFLLWEIIHRCLTILTCEVENSRKLCKSQTVGASDDSHRDVMSDDNNDKNDSESGREKYKKKKNEKRELILLIIKNIVDSISAYIKECQVTGEKVVSRWFVWILQRLQQILFENYKSLSNSQDVLQSIILSANMEEHIVEIIKRFQSYNV